MNIVECREISKVFHNSHGNLVALDRISFSLPEGKIIGLLGPDAAGKTTLLRILTGLMPQTSGTASVLGFDTRRQAGDIQSRIGYMPQKFGLYENLSVEENLKLYADLHAIGRMEQQQRFARLLKVTALEPFKTRMAGKLSGGMKQKLALACALVSKPPFLILDEASVGVDVLSRRELWHILRELVSNSTTTVLASTAYMDEAGFCDRTLILFEGRLVADVTPKELCMKAAGVVPNPSLEDGFQVLLAGKILPPLKRMHPVQNDAKILIHADQIVKKFGSFVAVDHVSFDVRQGEIFGLLGANGAGKTTTFRMLCGLSSANDGTIEIHGLNLRRASGSARAKIGFVAQKFSLYGDLTVQENLRFFGGAYGLHGPHLKERVEWGIEQFALNEFRKQQAAKLPLGYKQRLSMACALLHEPEILFLDEATSGADPMARHEFWKRIMALADSGVAVIITTHFLEEATYCDRMVIMQNGIAAAAGNVDEIRHQGKMAEADELPSMEEAFVNIIKKFRQEHGLS